ncbi:MAG: RelA/SpoT family protein [Patescibacteria group bacterium]
MPDIKEIINLMATGVRKEDQELINKAYKFAEKAHGGQKRMSGDPYFTHVYETAKTLAELGMDPQTIAAGFLHDVLEDTEITEKEIEKEFGKEILFLINGVTKLGTVRYRGYQRHVESLRKFFMAMTDDIRVVIIKLADRLHNLRTLDAVREDKRLRIAMESINVYAPLANRLGIGKLKSEIEDAAFPYIHPVEFAEMEEIIKEKKDLYEKNLEEVKESIEKELAKNKIKISRITYRMKHKYSLWKKLMKRDMDIDKVYDVVAMRVIVKNIEDCYRVLGIIHSIWKPLPGRIKDYVAVPKPNGYRSIHTTIFTGSGGTAEIQIRTEEMHNDAVYGIAAHFFYKEAKRGQKFEYNDNFKWIEDLKNLNYNPEDPKTFLEHLKVDFFSDRIFIFTPKGDVIDLPEDSTPIDFAYSIHSDVGDHISGVRINGKMSPIFTKLKNRDIVDIIKKNDAHPSNKWLEHVKTVVAKKHIKSYLEKNTLLSKLKSIGK